MNKRIYAIICFFSIASIAQAQKLPTTQKNSLFAPADIKVDGKTSEWNNKFQAYNNNTNFFYTISNDDKNLYLIIQVTDPVIINKIVSAGITFVINKSGKKEEESAVAITYPLFDIKDRPMIDVKNTPKIDKDSPASVLKADSFMADNNKRLKDKSKYIKVTGAKDLDTLVSVYNHEGIKATELFDNRMIYTYELAVDLKHLELSESGDGKFAYEIKSNGATLDNLNGVSFGPPKPGSRLKFGSIIIGPGAMPPSAIPVMTSTTNFWGEYTLAKK
ncbi:hypothetical protein [Mucilaginibacter lappiensis]|uniref:Uncharacterized protein n=1 Tax=Mucilaginibacter lappiensis TaxID=354630 RepID=A0A841JT79_9SPHI|nr:hypothetical protein [Mucilaginibacter lappiensis]MBB6131485.1 hypothetical protein [Mucilaginibacter lappiensis]